MEQPFENTDAPKTSKLKNTPRRRETYAEWYPRFEAASNGETVNFPDHPFIVEWNRSTDFYQYVVGMDRSIVGDVARKVRETLEKRNVRLKPKSPIILRILYDTRRGLRKLICTGGIVTTSTNGAATCEPIEIEFSGKPILSKPEEKVSSAELPSPPIRLKLAPTFPTRTLRGIFGTYLKGASEHIKMRVREELRRRRAHFALTVPIYVTLERYKDKPRGRHEMVTTCFCRIYYVNTKNDTRAIPFEFDMTFPA